MTHPVVDHLRPALRADTEGGNWERIGVSLLTLLRGMRSGLSWIITRGKQELLWSTPSLDKDDRNLLAFGFRSSDTCAMLQKTLLSLQSSRTHAFLLGFALLLTVVYATQIKAPFHFVDERDYYAIALHLRHDHSYEEKANTATAYRAPGFPWEIAALQSFHEGQRFAKIANLAWWLLSIVLAASLARKLFGQLAANLTLLLTFVYAGELFTAGTLYPQGMASALFLLSLWLHFVWTRRLTMAEAFSQAIVWSALILTVPTFLVNLVILLGWYLLRDRRIAQVAVVVVLVGGSCLAWSFRNQSVLHQFVFIADNSGTNLYLGNSPLSGPNTGVQVPLNQLSPAAAAQPSELARESAYKQASKLWMREHPKHAAILYLQKFLNWFNCRSNLATKSENSVLKDLAVAIPYYAILLLACVAFFVLRPMRPVVNLFWGQYLLAAAFYAVFFTRVRFRLPYDYLLIVLAAGALAVYAEARPKQQAPAMQFLPIAARDS